MCQCRGLGYDGGAFGVEISVPGSTQLRQLAMWYELKSLPATAHLFQGETLRDDAVDLKESLRLRYALHIWTYVFCSAVYVCFKIDVPH